MQEFQTAHPMLQKALPAHHPNIARSLSHLGELARLLGQPDQALKLLQSAAETFGETLEQNHPDIASCRFQMGLAWKFQGKLDRAKQEFDKARQIWIATAADDDESDHHADAQLAWQMIQECESSSSSSS